MRARIVVMKSDPSSAVSFPVIVVYHSEFTVVRCSSGTIATCPVFSQEQAIIFLEVLCAQATFVGFGSS